MKPGPARDKFRAQRRTNVERQERVRELLSDIRAKSNYALSYFNDPSVVVACSADIELAATEIMDILKKGPR